MVTQIAANEFITALFPRGGFEILLLCLVPIPRIWPILPHQLIITVALYHGSTLSPSHPSMTLINVPLSIGLAGVTHSLVFHPITHYRLAQLSRDVPMLFRGI
jgi:hypothetical protein